MQISRDYLEHLLQVTREKTDAFVPYDVDSAQMRVTFLPTKRRAYLGLRSG